MKLSGSIGEEVHLLHTHDTFRRGEKSGPGRPRSPATDQAILRAALELFIQYGIDGVNVERIAASAGVARTTVYRRWSSKEALLAQAIAAARGAADEQAAEEGGELTALAQRLITALAEMVTAPEYRTLVARLIGSLPSSPELLATYWDAYMAPRREWVGQILRQQQEQGYIRGDADPEMLLDLISGAIVYQVLIRPGTRTVTEMHDYLHRVLRELGLEDTAERLQS
jgi:AcrR family transcriptional regulator